MTCATPETTTRIPSPLCSTLLPPKGGRVEGGAATGPIRAGFCATLRHLCATLLDPGLFAQTWGFRGYLGVVAFCAITEAAWYSL
jgi:hypothetical protein